MHNWQCTHWHGNLAQVDTCTQIHLYVYIHLYANTLIYLMKQTRDRCILCMYTLYSMKGQTEDELGLE